MAEMDDAKARLEKKRHLHNALDELANSDDEPDPGHESSKRAMRKASVRPAKPAPAIMSDPVNIPRSVSDTNVPLKDQSHDLRDDAWIRPPATAGKIVPPTLRKGATLSGILGKARSDMVPSSSAVSAVTGKRKRGDAVKLVPEAQRIFKGLRFYFFPNDDKHPARKMRINKAVEFGATWEKDWNDGITHVIADKSMDHALLLRYLKQHNKIDAIPTSVIVVTENYPAECISYRTLLEPKQRQYRIKGFEPPVEPVKAAMLARPVSVGSEISLKLKPAGKEVIARPHETPESTDSASPMVSIASNHNRQHIETAAPQPRVLPQAESTAEFDKVIQQARELQHVPLDDADEELTSRPTSSEGLVTDDEEEPKADLQLVKKRKSKYETFQDKFQCMQKHIGEEGESPNAATIAILQSMADYYGQIGDEWRIRAYRKAISTLRNHSEKVWSKEEALKLPQIGERLATKIEEIAYTNRLRRLDNARAEPSDQVLQTFMQVYGAGFAQATKWVSQGYITLNELLEKATLTENQRIGVEHYEDFNSRIPRVEVEQHGNIVRTTLHSIDPAFEVIIGGSYRRGAATSGDIDCLITRPDTGSAHIRAVVLDQLVPKLTEAGFLVAALATTNKDDGTKWHGASKLPGNKIWRRIDLLLVPSDELGAALIYFSGDDIFNRSIRLLASTKGMRLNQRGLYKDVIRDKGRVKLSEGTLVEGKDERKIFEALGVPWRPPEHRIC